jgi:hypothetical protein
MFVSKKFLVSQYGIDETIAKFFVDREPPKNNLYWHEKYLYVQPTPGYLFIPLVIDLLFKIGIDKEQLLAEEFVTCMEQIGNISALEETKQITEDEGLARCKEIALQNCKNEKWLDVVSMYFDMNTGSLLRSHVTPYKALHRGDVFLFSLAAIDFSENMFEKVAQYWFALISTLLLLDDAEDIEVDRVNGDENAFLEGGLTKEAVEKIKELVGHNLRLIATANSVMANKIDMLVKDLLEKPHLKPLITY